MRKSVNPLLLSGAALALSACATVTRGTSETFVVETTPAGAQVVLSNEMSCEATPCSFEVKRKEEFTATITKEGFVTEEHDIGTVTAEGGRARTVGNFIIGGIVALGVDAKTGAGLDHVPNPLQVTLRAEGSEALSSEETTSEEGEAPEGEESVDEALEGEASVDEASEDSMAEKEADSPDETTDDETSSGEEEDTAEEDGTPGEE